MAPLNQETGLLVSFKRLCATVLEIGQVRIELLGTELELEKKRIFEGLLWAAAALMVLVVGLLLLCGFIILLVWDGYRLVAIGLMTLVFLSAAFFLFLQARKRLSHPEGMFHVSASELKKDQFALRPKA